MFYTGKGDDGTSGIFGDTARCNKDEPIFHALGTVDEVNSLLGVCYAQARSRATVNAISVPDILRSIQEDLFILQAELSGADKHIEPEQTARLEKVMSELETHIENPNAFIISGSDELSAYLDFARTVARRAERAILHVHKEQEVGEPARIYLNRLSSVLYVLARYAAVQADVKEQNPSY